MQQATQIVSCHFCFDEGSQTSGWGWKGGGNRGQNEGDDDLSDLKGLRLTRS